MIALIINWLAGNWKSVGVGIVVAALGIWIGGLKYQIGAARGEVARLQGEVLARDSEIAGWKESYSRLEASAQKQAKAVQALLTESEKKQAAYTTALAAAKKRAADSASQAEWLRAQLNQPTPAGKGCREALQEWRTMP